MGALQLAAQPSLRAFPVYDTAPTGTFSFPVMDQGSEPILHLGEFAIIDPAQRQPVHGELFLIEWHSGRREIVECVMRLSRRGAGPAVWWVGSYNRPRTAEALARRPAVGGFFNTMDGPYAADGPGADYLPSKLVGRVTGVLVSALDEASLRRVK